MLLGFHRPIQFLYHHSKAKGRINLFFDNTCYVVDKVTSYAPTESMDIPGLHLINRGYSEKIHISDDTNIAIIY